MWTLPPSLAPAQKFAALALSQDVGIYTLEAVGAVDFTGNLARAVTEWVGTGVAIKWPAGPLFGRNGRRLCV
jgi:hypothetical protein